MKILANGPPKAGTTALTMILEDGFGIPRTRGTLTQRRGRDAYMLFSDRVYATRPLADHLDGRTKVGNRELRYLKQRRSLAEGLAAIADGEVIHSHLPPRRELTGYKVITVLRDPRDNVVSWFRAKTGYGALNRHRRSRLERFIIRDSRFIPWMQSIWKWRRQNLGIVVSYKALFEASTINAIAEYIERDPVDVAHLEGTGPNWSGDPSRWQDWFTDAARARFNERWGDLPMEIRR